MKKLTYLPSEKFPKFLFTPSVITARLNIAEKWKTAAEIWLNTQIKFPHASSSYWFKNWSTFIKISILNYLIKL